MGFECERHRRDENFEFLDSLERYFTYFRTRSLKKSYNHKKAFLSRLMLLDRKNIHV